MHRVTGPAYPAGSAMVGFGGTKKHGWAAAALVGLALPASANAVPPIPGKAPVVTRSDSRLLTTDNGGWSVGQPTSYRYRWYRCTSVATTSCAAVPVSTKSYVLRTADIGRYLRSQVVARNGNDTGTSAMSNAYGPIAAAPPRNHGRPEISGVTLRGEPFISDPGVWSGRVPGDPPYTYEWQRCASAAATSCSPIAGASRATYTSTAADVGRHIRVVVGAEGLGRSRVASSTLGPVFVASATATKRLTPFPVLVIVGRLRGSRTHISEFVVRAPRRARVSVRCRGKRCPFRLVRGQVGRRKRLRLRKAQRTFRTGQILEIRVTGRNRIGKFTRVTFRRGRAPRRSDLCLSPGAKTPRPCSEVL
jgi:hypothetical protein